MGKPPSARITGPNGGANNVCLPIQCTRSSYTKVMASITGKSQFDVCGAANST